MTFNKMRFPIVWITLALCVVLCAIEVHSGPVDQQDLRHASKDYIRTARQEPYNDDSDDENDDGSDEGNDDDGGDDSDDDGGDEERSLKRHVREASQTPLLVEEQHDEDSTASTDAPSTDKPTKKPSSVLHLLSSALDKAIAATTKLPTQQMASDAASVFLLLGQVFSEAIEKVIGDDGPDEDATEIGITDATETPAEEFLQLPITDQPVKAEKQPQINSSQSDMEIARS